VGDDQLRPREAVDKVGQVLGDRRQPAAAVDQDRHLPIGGQLEDGDEALVVELDALRARCSLMPSAPARGSASPPRLAPP